jgi:hypothetical protein
MPENDNFMKRMPSVPRGIGEIKDNDVRVRLMGTIIDRSDSGIVLDDGSGKINVSLENTEGLAMNQFVRVFGRVIPMEGGSELQGEIVQPAQSLDIELLKKSNNVVKSL